MAFARPGTEAAGMKEIEFTMAAGDFHRLYEKSLLATRTISRKRLRAGSRQNSTRCQRRYVLDQLARQVKPDLLLHTKRNVAECGVYKGSSAYMIAARIKDVPNVQFHLFDSFEGLSAIGEKDEGTKITKQFRCPLNTVQKRLRKFKFIKYYPGWIPERFEEVKDLRFSFVHIDVDLYQPTYDSLAFFYPRLNTHGIIAFDDYGTAHYPGARKAINEYLKGIYYKDYMFMNTPAGEAFLIKWGDLSECSQEQSE
jgi:hypothetical protein